MEAAMPVVSLFGAALVRTTLVQTGSFAWCEPTGDTMRCRVGDAGAHPLPAFVDDGAGVADCFGVGDGDGCAGGAAASSFVVDAEQFGVETATRRLKHPAGHDHATALAPHQQT